MEVEDELHVEAEAKSEAEMMTMQERMSKGNKEKRYK